MERRNVDRIERDDTYDNMGAIGGEYRGRRHLLPPRRKKLPELGGNSTGDGTAKEAKKRPI